MTVRPRPADSLILPRHLAPLDGPAEAKKPSTDRVHIVGLGSQVVGNRPQQQAQGGENLSDAERKIPLPIQREVRQRCGFGCVICGVPSYEYHHMKGWATVKEHVAEDITLLCDGHHREVTSGLLPEEKVSEANARP